MVGTGGGIESCAGRGGHLRGRRGGGGSRRRRGGGLGAGGEGGGAVGGEGGRGDLCDGGIGWVGGGAGTAGAGAARRRGGFPALFQALFHATSSSRHAASAGGRAPVAAPPQSGVAHDRLRLRPFHPPRSHPPR